MTARAPTLSQILHGAPLVVCLGPGGVGKTTVSSILALRQAGTGKRSLVLTIDPARRLADALGLEGLTNEPVEVASLGGLHPQGRLSALMLDTTATFDRLIAKLVSDPARRESLYANRYYHYISRSLAGTLEYMAVERLHDLAQSGEFDAIVLDTPPTANALDFVEAPERLALFFSDRVVKWLTPAKGREGWTARLFSRAGSVALSLMAKVAGEEFVQDTSGFFGAFSDLFGSFRARGLEVGKILRDPRTVFLVVCTPEEGRIEEAKEIDRRLAEAGCRVNGFIVNRVEAPFAPADGELFRAVARAAEKGGSWHADEIAAFADRFEKMRGAHLEVASGHERVVQALRSWAAPRPVFCAPRVPTVHGAREALLELYEGLFREEEKGGHG